MGGENGRGEQDRVEGGRSGSPAGGERSLSVKPGEGGWGGTRWTGGGGGKTRREARGEGEKNGVERRRGGNQVDGRVGGRG